MKKRICFVTGTRADFGKLKPLMLAVEASEDFECLVFATGMHPISRYGFTVEEIHKAGFLYIYTYMNHVHGEPMELVLANTISGLSRYVHESRPDMLVVHGDRVEALAGAIVGALRNVLVAHIEGGELSGTIDELIRHSVTKLSHVHFVANEAAAQRLHQLGEDPRSVYPIGSPEIDIMLAGSLPSLATVRDYYEIPFDTYAIAVLHPVTTELDRQRMHAEAFVAALLESGDNYVVIYPNNDSGSDEIFAAFARFADNPRFRVFPSMRFEYFLSLLKQARYIVGNSSAGVREAPVYAVPTINVGNRQHNRFQHESIINVAYDQGAINQAIGKAMELASLKPCHYFGDGKSALRFMASLRRDDLWATPKQKQFCDIPLQPVPT